MASCCWCNEQTERAFVALDEYGRALNYVVCNNCRTLQLDTLIGDNRGSYDPDYYGVGSNKFIEPFNTLFNHSKKRAAGKLSKLIAKNSRIMDVGAGRGDFLLCFKTLGYSNLVGTELKEHARHSTDIEWYYGIDALEKYDGPKLQLVTIIHVFEHLPAPKEVIKQLTRIVAAKGYLVISYPNIDSRQYQLFKGHWFHLDPPRHLHLIPPAQIIDELSNHGFVLVYKHQFAWVYDPIGYIQSIFNKLFQPRNYFYNSLKSGFKFQSIFYRFYWVLMLLFTIFTLPLFLIISIIDSLKGAGATVELVFQKE
ncbi:methyltransferase domain-containing protein [bacterium]|nr:methyltransferase domain-containing protein [bacterium]